MNSYTSLHCHLDYSNASLGFPDAMIKYNELIDTAYELGLRAVSITDHECISSHIKALQYFENKEMDRDFKLILGNEIYLVSEKDDWYRNGGYAEYCENNPEGKMSKEELEEKSRTPFYHFLLNALDNEGHKQIRELSDRAWGRAYSYHGVMRRPTYYSDIEEIIGDNKGHVVASSACLGGVIPKEIVKGNIEKAKKCIQYFVDVFGKENFFLEVQPCLEGNEEQILVNNTLLQFNKEMGIKLIATTDAHYLKKNDIFAHKVLLNSKDDEGKERETEEFYATTYLMSGEELREYLRLTFDDETIDEIFENTNSIADRVEGYNFKHTPMIPQIPLDKIPPFEISHRYKKFYDKYKDFGYYSNATDKQDRYAFYRIEKALVRLVEEKGKDIETYIDRLNSEFHELKIISEAFNSSMASYYTTMSKIIEIIWNTDSFSMPARGSGAGFLICYLLDITQIDPVPLGNYFPFWRHLSAERGVEIADIDNDSQNAKRDDIIEAIRDYFGADRVLNVATFSTLSSKTAIEKVGKGLKKINGNITDETIGFLKSLVPVDRGSNWSLHDCFYGNEEKGRKPVKELINEVEKYEGMKECIFAIEGLIVNRGIHASGVLIGNEPYVNQLSSMRSPNMVLCSSYDLHDCEYCGWTKVDILSIIASDKIRKTMDLLVEHGYMEWQGSLKDTYWKYLHPDVLDYDNQEMWDKIKQIYSIFEFDTPVAIKALNEVEPHSVMELSSTNSLLRLMGQNGKEQPLAKYRRYKNDIRNWYKDMEEYGLNKEEIETLKEHLDECYGLAESQEKVMLLSMDNRISGFTLKQANKLRKAIAKKNPKVLEETKQMFFEYCEKRNVRPIFAKYIWEEQLGMSFGYSFSQLHSYSYSVIALQELNLNYYYPPIYWNTACLTIESQSDENNKKATGQTDYGKIAKAIYKMKNFGVNIVAPDINESEISFTPDEKNNRIIFGLGGISGINIKIAKEIIDKRPYKNFKDFYDKHSYKGSLITKTKFITLIKSGCFDATDDRISAMKWLAVYETPTKNKLKLANVPMALSLGIEMPLEYIRPYRFVNYVKKHYYCDDPKFKSKKHYLVESQYALPYFMEKCIDKLKEGIDYYYADEGLIVVDKSLEKCFKEEKEKLKEYLATEECVKEFNLAFCKKNYLDMIKQVEDVNRWSFEALSFYSDNHELSDIDFGKYNITDFDLLPTEPNFTEKFVYGRTWKQYNISRICGTVIDKKDKDGLVFLLTPSNKVVSVRFNKGQFSYYKQDITIGDQKDEGYFKRGTLLMVSGYRRGEEDFVAKKYKNTIYQHTAVKILGINKDGELDLQVDRLGSEE